MPSSQSCCTSLQSACTASARPCCCSHARATAKDKLAAARKLRDAELVRAWSELDGVAPDDLLCAACAVGDRPLARRAIRLGADIDSDGDEIDDDPGKEGIRMAFESAISGKHLDVVRWLCKHRGVHPRFSLLAAIKIGDLDLVQSITREHGEGIVHEEWIHGVSSCDWVRLYGYTFRDQESALSMAAEHGQMEIVKWLCDTIGVDVEGAMHRALGVTCIGPSGLDPARNVEVARFLLERGAKTSFCSAEQYEGEVVDLMYNHHHPPRVLRPHQRGGPAWPAPGPARAASARLSEDDGQQHGRRSEFGAERGRGGAARGPPALVQGGRSGQVRAPAPGVWRRPAGANKRHRSTFERKSALGASDPVRRLAYSASVCLHRRASRSSVRPCRGGGGQVLSCRPTTRSSTASPLA
jgi:hypothetical protein